MFITFLVLPIYWIRSIILRKYGSNDKKYRELKIYAKHYLGFRSIKLKIHGEQPDPSVAAVYFSNHQSMNDIFITLGSINRQFRFVAKKELFTSVISGPFMRMSESYALDRDDARASLLMLKDVVSDVKSGSSVLAFPEGTRSHQKELLPFKDGLFSMLRKANAPIVPMYIKESFNEKQKVFNVYFAPALLVSDYENLKGKDLSDLVFSIMESLMRKAYT